MGGTTKLFKKKTRPKRRQMKTSEQAATEYRQARDKAIYGSLGGASPVRRIDPNTGKIVAVIDPETRAPAPIAHAKAPRRWGR